MMTQAYADDTRVELPLLTEAPVDGAQIIIYHPTSKTAMTATASGSKLAGTSATVTDNNLTVTDAMALLNVSLTNGEYTFTNSEGKYLTSGATGNSLSFTDSANDCSKWTLEQKTDNKWVLMNVGAAYNGNHNQALEYYSGYTTYGVKDTDAYKFQFFGNNTTPTGPFTVTIQQAEHGTITASKTADIAYNEEITITMTPDEGYVADKLFVNGAAFNPAATDGVVTVKITRDTTVTGEFKEETSEPPATGLAKLTEAPLDGAKVVIYYPASQLAMTATASGNKLAGTAATVTDGVLTPTDAMAQLDVTVDNGVYTFTNSAGKYLTSGATGNSLTFADAESDYSKWTLEQQADGTWYVINLNAVYNNNKQALEYYNGFTTYGVKANNSAYKFEFYGTQGVEKLSKITFAPQNGANLVIYYPASQLVMTSTASGNKLAGTAATLENNKLVVTEEMARLDVTLADGVYTFKNAEGKYLTSGATGNSLTFAAAESDYSKWTLEKQSDGTWYIINLNAVYNNNKQALEYYNGFTTYGVKANNSAYKFEFYGTSDEPTEPPTGDTFGLASTLATGDEVIIFNEANKKGVSSTMSGTYYLSGKEYTPVDGVITTGDTDVVWTVTKNDDGTYLFKQGDKTLGGVQTTNSSTGAIYNNIDLSGSSATKWTMEAAGTGVYLYLGELPSSKEGGHIYFDWYTSKTAFSLVDYANPGTNTAFMFTFYKKGAEPEQGDLVTSLDQLTDGTTVAIYNQKHMTAISNKPNGDWYLKANPVVMQNGKITQFTEDNVWTVKKNDDGTYTFYAYGDENRSIAVWSSTVGENTYAEMTVDSVTYPDDTWTLTPAATANCFYFKSATVTYDNKPAYINAYTNYGVEFFRGSFTTSINEDNMALQFYLINPEDATPPFDDGTWDGILTPGEQYVVYNETADAVLGLFKEANYAYDAIPTEFTDTNPILAIPGNGAYAFTVGSTGRYYTFKIGDKYMASNNEEELYLEELHDGQVPDNAKWFLWKNGTGYVIYNKEANYNGSNVCIEYFSSVFSGWTYKNKTKDIFLFNFYKVTEDTDVHEGVVQDPSVIFDCEDSRYIEQDFPVTITLDDLADEITDIEITFTAGSKTGTITDYEVSSDGKNYTFTIPASEIDVEEGLESFELNVNVVNSYGIEYEGSKTVAIVDEPFFEDLTPAPNSQTRDDKRPVVSARVGNVGEEPTFTLKLNDEVITDLVFENGILSYTPTADMEDGRVNVLMTVTRKDGVSAEKSWNFTVGISDYQLYFGQLHSHTTYSDGSGTLETALDYIGSLPESANVQFVAFTDHSNYFDAPNAANPADALNDKSLMTAGSLADWNTYKETIAAFNAKQSDVIAIGGFEMTWSGGPGHINTYDSDGLVSRNNALLNNKTNDAGMKLYYETINKGESLNQFNHPGTTFGNFTDFSYWNEETDAHMFLVEVGNGEGQIGAGGYYPSYEQYTLALDQGWHLAPTNNQDNHKGRWGNANDARDVILTNDFSEEGIYNAIRDLRVYATEDKNLQISYTMNDEPMGTIFTEENTPETLNTVITVYDPNNYDGTAKVELVANGGVVAKTWNSAEELAEGLFTAELTPEYGYYFVRVTQEDGDIAVTAPIWTGLDVAVGIKQVNVATEQPLVNQPMTINTTLFNNEEAAVNVKSLTYTVDGSTVIGTDNAGHSIAAGGEITVPFEYTPTVAKRMTVTVTAVFTVGDKEVTYSKDVTFSVRENDGDLPVTDIAVVNSQTEEGFEYAIEGVVTSNASGYDKDTAFFDCIYVQDATGGICCFPVSGEYKIGDKVHIEGYTDFYQGEPELQVTSIAVIGEGTVAPTEVTAAQINDLSVLGSLVTVKGTVDSVEEVNGLIQTIMIRDANGDVARVFIDGYITTADEVKNCVVGAQISATGISSYDDTFNAPEGPFPRIRIRNRADIICTVEDPLVTVTVTKAWESLNMSQEAPEGATATFNLFANGEDTGLSIVLDGVVDPGRSDLEIAETEPWVATFAGLHRRDDSGNEIAYTVIESDAYPGYGAEYADGKDYAVSGGTIINREEMTTISVTKAWVNADGTTTAPEGAAVKFTLFADGENTGFDVTLIGQEDGDPIMQGGQEHEPWTAVFVRLPKYKVVNGEAVEINYTVTETETWPGYKASYGAEDATFAVDGGTITNTEKPAEPTIPHLRVKGSSRYDTAFQAANYMKQVKGIDRFDTVVVAYGADFADALSGSYLAAVAEAPILLVHPKYEGDVLQYIGNNVKPAGKIYLLGGKGVVSEEFEQQLKNASFDVTRLGGKNRFATNVLILEEANKIDDTNAKELLVCSATSFADALSTSSVGKPILLVSGDSLNEMQTKYINEYEVDTAWIIGGTGAVSQGIENNVGGFLSAESIKRLKGSNRYETSQKVAEEFFPDGCETAVLVYGQDFPDGLSGGAVAAAMNSPVLLAMNNESMNAYAAKWVGDAGVKKSVTFGGTALISDESIRTIMDDPDAEIVLFE
ncbi:MAG: cell wall-binding repeat-containing protein [Clostridia bacterium]|nr:cell wall-binding repeat-containing protein [Clostridia bacterium]